MPNARSLTSTEDIGRIVRKRARRVRYSEPHKNPIAGLKDVIDELQKIAEKKDRSFDGIRLTPGKTYFRDQGTLRVSSIDGDHLATEEDEEMLSFWQDIIYNGYHDT